MIGKKMATMYTETADFKDPLLEIK